MLTPTIESGMKPVKVNGAMARDGTSAGVEARGEVSFSELLENMKAAGETTPEMLMALLAQVTAMQPVAQAVIGQPMTQMGPVAAEKVPVQLLIGQENAAKGLMGNQTSANTAGALPVEVPSQSPTGIAAATPTKAIPLAAVAKPSETIPLTTAAIPTETIPLTPAAIAPGEVGKVAVHSSETKADTIPGGVVPGEATPVESPENSSPGLQGFSSTRKAAETLHGRLNKADSSAELVAPRQVPVSNGDNGDAVISSPGKAPVNIKAAENAEPGPEKDQGDSEGNRGEGQKDFKLAMQAEVTIKEPAKEIAETKVPVKIAENRNLFNNVAHQLVKEARLNLGEGANTMQIRLHPAYLGNLTLDVTIEKGMVKAFITAEVAQVKDMLEANLGSLKQNLQEAGLQVDNLSVSLGSSGTQQSGNGQTWVNRQQQGTGGNARGGNGSGSGENGSLENMATKEAHSSLNAGYTVNYLA